MSVSARADKGAAHAGKLRLAAVAGHEEQRELKRTLDLAQLLEALQEGDLLVARLAVAFGRRVGDELPVARAWHRPPR